MSRNICHWKQESTNIVDLYITNFPHISGGVRVMIYENKCVVQSFVVRYADPILHDLE